MSIAKGCGSSCHAGSGTYLCGSQRFAGEDIRLDVLGAAEQQSSQ